MSISNQSNRSDAAKSGLNLTLDPIEKFIFDGLQTRFIEVFEAKAIWVTSTDKTKLLQKLFGTPAAGATETNIQYPYAFLTLGSVAPSEARGSIKALNLYGVRGTILTDDQKRGYRIKLSPIDFSVTIEYVTNNYKDVLNYTNKWTFARTNGWLRFNVNYGGTMFSIAMDLDGTVQIPQRDADLANPQEYVITTTLTMQGYMSFATLMEQQIVDTVQINTVLGAEGTTTTWDF